MTESKLNTIDKDVAKIQVVLDKLDQSVEKLTSISSDVTQLLAVREVRMTNTEKQVEDISHKVESIQLLPPMSANDIYVLVENTKKEIVSEMEELRNELLTKNTETTKKIFRLERWMWISIGALLGCGIFLSKVGTVLSALITALL